MEIDEEVASRKRKCAGDMQSSLIRRDKSLMPKKRRRFTQEDDDIVMVDLSSIWQSVDIPRIVKEPCRLIRGRPQFIFPKFVFLGQEPDDHESMDLEEWS
jgi:hypothetical protein